VRMGLCLAALAICCAFTPARRSSDTSQSQRSVIRGGVDAVALNVTAVDPARRYVTDLEQGEFLIFEDGRRQQLTFFQKTGLPLALVLLLDTSASMHQNLEVAQEAAIGFARQLGPSDLASVIDFDNTVRVRQGFTNDRDAIERAIRQTEADGSTALYNAVYIALKEATKSPRDERTDQPRRRAIVVLSDGDDTSSLVNFDEVLDLASRGDATIYAIGLGNRTGPFAQTSSDAAFVLKRLAEQTGGRTFFPSAARDLSGVYREIIGELSSQYSIAYESDNPRREGQFRRIVVRIDRVGVIARTRPGYYAPAR
jgi:Ca-activated chloride channel family protein